MFCVANVFATGGLLTYDVYYEVRAECLRVAMVESIRSLDVEQLQRLLDVLNQHPLRRLMEAA